MWEITPEGKECTLAFNLKTKQCACYYNAWLKYNWLDPISHNPNLLLNVILIHTEAKYL